MAVSSPSTLMFLVLISSSSSALLVAPAGPNPNYEVVYLMTIKNLLEDPQGVLKNWDMMSVDPCDWNLVTCSPENLVTRLVIGNPLICGANTGQDCSRTAPVPLSSNQKISQASLPTAKAKSHKFAVALGSAIACVIFLSFPIS